MAHNCNSWDCDPARDEWDCWLKGFNGKYPSEMTHEEHMELAALHRKDFRSLVTAR